MPSTLEGPGSLSDYIAERSHHSVAITEVQLRHEYFDRLAGFRRALAIQRGITLEELHNGVKREPISDERQPESSTEV